ncbi:glycosyltransferase-like protein LARGE2-like protein [Blastocystis sp. ATCC 50177/Nand II]|uniref:Glycosyltransferase-like protein LARGE2-like protein n=1 Tax=Blastocystis sp. subtype 1 (strain ATCC 50177 / NandII) TaxID=478820 RepID=A0A196SHD3_BLAHN|nr:glycosyltransferase-like protein LARGE2-like protein [Blastocystis sp. ATCC 50177/Nand II]
MPANYGSLVQNYTLRHFEGSVETPSTPSIPSNHTDVTIISQTTPERLFFFPYLLARWGGPISITIYLDPSNAVSVTDLVRHADYPQRLRLSLYTHIQPKKDCVYRPARRGLRCINRSIYPLNRLRNIAIANVQTTHFVVFDMDMWPAPHTYNTLLSLPSSYLDNPFFVTIIPAFSLSPAMLKHYPCSSFEECILKSIPLMPTSKKTMNRCLKVNNCTIFRPLSKTHNYLPSNWESLPPTTPVTYVKCFKERFLEPYVMVRRSEHLPPFDERFINYGFNKVEWVETLRYLGYEFYVLSHAFAVDAPHKQSNFAVQYSKQFSGGEVEMLELYRRYLMNLRHSHRDESRQVLCLPKRINLNMYRN